MPESQDNSNREIDLLDLIARIGRGLGNFLKNIYQAVLFLFVFGIRRIHILVLIAILGGAVGILVYKLSEKYYASEMIAQPNGFSSMDMAVYINDIHEMCRRGNVAGIANSLGLSEEIAEQVKNIEAFLYVDVNDDGVGDFVDYKNKYNPEDSTMRLISSRIVIRAEVFNNSVFHDVKQGLRKYISNNPYLVMVNAMRKSELQSLIAQSKEEIRKLDSLQDFEYYKSATEGKLEREGQIVFLNQKVTQLYYRDKISLLSSQLADARALELATEPITVIKDFTELTTEEHPLGRFVILYGFLAGLLAYFLLLILKYRKEIGDYFRQFG